MECLSLSIGWVRIKSRDRVELVGRSLNWASARSRRFVWGFGGACDLRCGDLC